MRRRLIWIQWWVAFTLVRAWIQFLIFRCWVLGGDVEGLRTALRLELHLIVRSLGGQRVDPH